jgi:hypothetical protein
LSENTRDWDDFDLERAGGTKTIVTAFGPAKPSKADIVIVVDYRYLGFNSRWAFRFVGVYIENWKWTKQPLGDVKSKLGALVDDSLKKHIQAVKNGYP